MFFKLSMTEATQIKCDTVIHTIIAEKPLPRILLHPETHGSNDSVTS